MAHYDRLSEQALSPWLRQTNSHPDDSEAETTEIKQTVCRQVSFCKGGDEYQYISEDHQSCIGFSIEHGISLAFDEGIDGVDSCVAKRKDGKYICDCNIAR